ncbi:YkgJ family cysteine cluster protein [Zoogloea sp.]|uniref:YkgJ family cysteine cluster protein n=1 Tax=Zoogloea sp. TaxID=49181 RepID=UPI0026195EE0|nr:YkgJ family cysteine cluster protein [uncultured Zoogloea sp.]
MPSTPASANPCQACGACCATFRVSFYWADAEARGLPPALTEQVNPWLGCMAGTNRRAPRCAALDGTIGSEVGCRVYEQRPDPCREVQAGDSQCLKARARHGLPALSATG